MPYFEISKGAQANAGLSAAASSDLLCQGQAHRQYFGLNPDVRTIIAQLPRA